MGRKQIETENAKYEHLTLWICYCYRCYSAAAAIDDEYVSCAHANTQSPNTLIDNMYAKNSKHKLQQ